MFKNDGIFLLNYFEYNLYYVYIISNKQKFCHNERLTLYIHLRIQLCSLFYVIFSLKFIYRYISIDESLGFIFIIHAFNNVMRRSRVLIFKIYP